MKKLPNTGLTTNVTITKILSGTLYGTSPFLVLLFTVSYFWQKCSKFYSVKGDFVYADFNQTTGLSFVGDTGLTNCISVIANAQYGQRYGDADERSGGIEARKYEAVDLYREGSLETMNPLETPTIGSQFALFGHRDNFDKSNEEDRCDVRVRLTPSQPGKRGAMWYEQPIAVNLGFETLFSFQITDPSTVCTTHRDTQFKLKHHKSCSVHGGDGIAFVLQGSEAAYTALGSGGTGMGYGGIPNSLAIEFDTWFNAESGSGDLAADHVSIHSASIHNNTSWETTMLGRSRVKEIGDGKVHIAKIAYYPTLRTDYLVYFSATENVLPYVKDSGENRRLGTLVIFIDEGIDKDEPLVAIPLNLMTLLDLPNELATVGFTSSTGSAWEKHDILSWYFCDDHPCTGSEEKHTFDYHQKSKFYTGVVHNENTPGEGYGGGDATGKVPTKHTSPITDPWAVEKELFADNVPEGLLDTNGVKQYPPYTEI